MTAEFECMKAGSDAFVTKPLTGATLSKAIERVLTEWEDDAVIAAT
jgi:FixJ family two-component response regulator